MSITQESLKSEDENSTRVEKVTKNKCERCGLPATFACPTCKERGIVTRSTCGNFCSQQCFKLEWPTHKLQHVRKANRGLNNESPMKLHICSTTSAQAIRNASSASISSDPDRLYKYWGLIACKSTDFETVRRLQFIEPLSAPPRCGQTSDDQIEIEFFDERMGHVSSDVANIFIDEDWYETILLPFVSEAPTWQEFVETNCRLFSCTTALYLSVLAMVCEPFNEISGHGGKVNKRGNFKLILRDQNCKEMTRREAMYINADGEHFLGLPRKIVDLFWDVSIPFRALIPKVVLMNPPSLSYRCMNRRISPQDVEFHFFDREQNRHAHEIPSVYLNESWFTSCIQPHYYTGPTWNEFVGLDTGLNQGTCRIMSIKAGYQLGLLKPRDVAAGKTSAGGIDEIQKK